MSVYYPPTGFYFKVEFLGVSGMDSDTEQRFQDVSGLSFEIETEDHVEGGENRFVYKLPKRAKYPNLVLKRGMLQGTAILEWIKSAMNTYFTALVYDFQPADILITLLDEEGAPLAVWNVVGAYPIKWSTSDFSAKDNNLVIETIELAYQYFEKTL